jgi:selenocysteine-specific translation elongation factor
MVVINKADLPETQEISDNVIQIFKRQNITAISISAATHQGIDLLKNMLAKEIFR